MNRFKKFAVELDISVFEELRVLHDTEVYGKDIDRTAEIIFCEWVHSELPRSKRKNELLQQRAEEMGYVPAKPERKRQNPDTFGVVYIEFGGMPRYIVEHLPRAEPTSFSKNPYYQCSPEKIISMVLRREIPKRIEEFRREGLIDEDDLFG